MAHSRLVLKRQRSTQDTLTGAETKVWHLALQPDTQSDSIATHIVMFDTGSHKVDWVHHSVRQGIIERWFLVYRENSCSSGFCLFRTWYPLPHLSLAVNNFCQVCNFPCDDCREKCSGSQDHSIAFVLTDNTPWHTRVCPHSKNEEGSRLKPSSVTPPPTLATWRVLCRARTCTNCWRGGSQHFVDVARRHELASGSRSVVWVYFLHKKDVKQVVHLQTTIVGKVLALLPVSGHDNRWLQWPHHR